MGAAAELLFRGLPGLGVADTIIDYATRYELLSAKIVP
jgi:hypothetical protein